MTLSSRAMKPLGNALLMYVSSLAGAGFFLGILAAVLGLLLGRGIDGVADVVARTYLVEALVLPASLALAGSLARDQSDSRGLYATLALSLLAGVLAAILGGVAAALTFLLAGVNGPVILGGLDSGQFSAAVWSRIFWGDFLLVLAVTIVASLLLGAWSHTRAHAAAARR